MYYKGRLFNSAVKIFEHVVKKNARTLAPDDLKRLYPQQELARFHWHI